MKRLTSLWFNGNPTASREIRGKYVVFKIELEGKHYERIRPRAEFWRGDYLE